MTPLEIYHQHEYLIRLAVWKFFGSKERAIRIAPSFGCEYEDFESIAKTMLWEMALKHDEERVNFNRFATTAIHYKLNEYTKRKQSLLKLPHKNARELQRSLEFISMDKQITAQYGDYYLYHDIIPSNVSVERYVIRKLEFEERLSVLKEHERELIYMYLNGMNRSDISRELNAHPRAIQTRKDRAMKKIRKVV